MKTPPAVAPPPPIAIQGEGGLPAYAELFCFSNFTFLHGASHAQELVARAIELNYSAIAITDECSLAGVVRAHDAALESKFPLVLGSYFRLKDEDGEHVLSLLLLAQNREGYGNLCELITLGRNRVDKGDYLLHPDDLADPAAPLQHLRGMPDCFAILVPDYPASADPARLKEQAAWLARTFGTRARMGLVLLQQTQDDAHRLAVEQATRAADLPLAALGGVCMHVRSRKPLQDTLNAIRLGETVASCGYRLAPNAEQHLRSRLRLANLYPPAALAESVAIARACKFLLSDLKYEYPEELVPPGMTPAAYLRRETLAGAAYFFPQGASQKILDQIETELTMISDMAYEPYFLTVYDIVRFARSQGILCQGRGSAANSVVCFCLGITAVDPSQKNCSMLFARFISKERREPPDIDVDFEHQRREEVMQYIYNKYGRDRAALAAAVHTYRPRGVLRDVGKALGVDAAIVDAIARSHRWFDSKGDLLQRFAENGFDPDTPLAQQWARLSVQLLGFPRHLSQHSGGFVIARGKLSRMVPIQKAAMADRSVIEWDKDDLESLGLLKVDVLALGMLSALKRAFDLITLRHGKPFWLHQVPQEDSATYDMICKADTVGVFQIESRAQMSMLPRLRPRQFYDLVVQVAIVRPGPIQGGMVHPFLRRRQGLEAVDCPKGLEDALERTMGVPIFQEQVMQIAMIAGGFSPSEADGLRRAMAAWKRKGGIGRYHDQLITGMTDKGYDADFAEAIFKQMEGFGEYGFPESHAASFALLVYASCWVKCHEPAAFLCAMLNSQPLGFYSPSQLVQDARRHDIEVRPADVRISNWEGALEERADRTQQPAVRLGLSLIKGMRLEAAERITAARSERPFDDVADLARRAQLSRHDLQALAAANALEGLAGHRRDALWQAVGAVPDRDLLRPTAPREDVPVLAAPSEGEELVGDYASMGLTLNRHPLALLRPRLHKLRFMSAEMLNTLSDRQFACGCGIVTVRQRPGTAKGIIFMTIEDETGSVNVIIRTALLERQRHEVLNAPLLGVYGTWQSVGEVRHLMAGRLVDLSHLLGRLPTGSRDFC